MSNMKMNVRICQICGSSNAFFNYGAISCRACGAFFRRFVLLGKIYKCICQNEGFEIDKNMLITIGCKYCRLKKCIEKGMKKESNKMELNKNNNIKCGLVVRATNLQNFHRERRQFMDEKKDKLAISPIFNSDQIKSIGANDYLENFHLKQIVETPKLIQIIFGIINKAVKYRYSIAPFPVEFFQQFDSLESLLIANQNNLFENSNQKKVNNQIPQNSMYVEEKEIQKNGIFSDIMPVMFTELYIFANIARAIPNFRELQFDDQVTLLKNSTLATLLLNGYFFSAKKRSETMTRFDGKCLYSMFVNHYSDQILLNAARKIFHLPIREFMHIDLTNDEFALLFPLLLFNSAVPDLTQNGQEILKGLEEKYGKMLLGLQQRQFGENAGALRYMETLRLLWSTIRLVQKHHEIAEYIDTFYEPGRFKQLVPKAISPLMKN